MEKHGNFTKTGAYTNNSLYPKKRPYTKSGLHWLKTVVRVSCVLTAALFAMPLVTTLVLHRNMDAFSLRDVIPPVIARNLPDGLSPDHSVSANETVSESVFANETVSGTDNAIPADGNSSQADNTGSFTTEGTAQNPAFIPDAETLSLNGQRDGECILRVLMHTSGTVAEMNLGEYLTGVVRGEMPAAFEIEALKAQAVAARTYTRYMLLSGGKHGGKADICTDSNCCQAYVSVEQARKNWGNMFDAYEEKISGAVASTDGEVIGSPILAVFHSSSAGLTRTAEAVWSGGQPYLQPVLSPEDESVPNYYSRSEFTVSQLRQKLLSAFPRADLSGAVSGWLSDVERDEAGSILTVSVGGIRVQGSKVRMALGLRSACFTWEQEDGKMIFYVTGFGHGVGLSQYGANQMAKDGASWREILTHYYTGVTLDGYFP